MNWNIIKPFLKALVVIAIVAGSLSAMLPVDKKIHLGLDLIGGSRLLLQLQPTQDVPKITPDIQEETKEVIDRRIDALGVAEPEISKVGSNRIEVSLPNVKDPAEAEKLLKQAAVLEFKIVPPTISQQAYGALNDEKLPNLSAKQRAADEKYLNVTSYVASGPVLYPGKDLKGAQSGFGQASQPLVLFQTKDPKRFLDMTSKHMGQLMGIFLDHRFMTDATIQGEISDSGEITGLSQIDTVTISNELNAGALPVSIEIIENNTIGPTLGKIDLVKSLYASMFGLGLVLLFMIVVYRLPGFLAGVALAIYVVAMLGVLAYSGATLTLPGIAGFVLSIGMAVDANVLIFERLKEELWNGKAMRAAVRVGFTRAFTAVFDSHFTTIVGAGVLDLLGTGTVKGFAFTLFWGTVISLFTAVFITRFFVDVLVDNDVLTAPPLYGVRTEDVGVFSKVGA